MEYRCSQCGSRITVFSRQEIFELNEWIAKRRGTYEDWLCRREIDRRVAEEVDSALLSAGRDSQDCEEKLKW